MAGQTDRSLTVRFPETLHEQLKKAAEREDRSLAQLLRVAARHYLQDQHAEAQPAA